MADIIIEKKCEKIKDEIWSWMESKHPMIEKKLKREKPRFDINSDEFKAKITGKHFTANIVVEDKLISCSIALPLLFRAFKGKVTTAITELFDELD